MNKKFYIVMSALFLTLYLTFTTIQAAPGSLDFTFDGDGKVTTQIGVSNANGLAVALQTDGKMVVVGASGGDFTILRYNTDGSLDLSFDADGIVITPVADGADNDAATSVVIQADGKIVVAGYYNLFTPSLNKSTADNFGGGGGTNFTHFAVVRYNINGSLDTGFDSDGIAKTTISGNGDDVAQSVAIQTDGKIVAAGYTSIGNQDSNFAAVRYNTNGSLDTTFNAAGLMPGVVTTDINFYYDYAASVVIQTDGKIVVVGTSGNFNSSNSDFAVVRYNADGTNDTTFSADGKVTTHIANGDNASAVALQGNGKIIVVGGVDGADATFATIRYNSDGSLDTGFDSDGIVLTNVVAGFENANAVKVQSDGKIIVGGNAAGNFGLVRYSANGALDTSWGTNGIVTTDFGFSNDIASSLAIQTDGKIVAAGSSGGRIAVARYFGPPIPIPGELDLTFDTDGKVTTCCGNSPGHSVAIQYDGKIVVGGSRINLSNFRGEIWLVRYNTDGSIDASFGNSGTVTVLTVTDNAAPGRVVIAIQSDSKIVVAYSGAGSSGHGTFVYRFNPNGSSDASFGTNGVVNVHGDLYNDVYSTMALTIQPDGKILVAVRHHEDVANSPIVMAFGVLRFNSDGSPDSTFGNNGFAFTTSLLGNPQSQDIPEAITVQADGKIVMVGLARRSNGSTAFGVVRYNPNGSLDTSFDSDGIVTTQIGIAGDRDEPYSVGIQPDGKIVVAGFSRDNTVFESFAVVRYNSNGSLDTSFDGDGKLLVFGGYATSNKLIIQPNGKIVIGGGNNGGDFALLRFNSDGSPDGIWGTNGIVTTDFGNTEQVNSMALQTDGKIVAVGSYSNITAIARYIGDEITTVVNTPAGSNVTVQSGNATVTFALVSQAGTTSFTPINPSTAGTLPGGYWFGSGLPAFEISTTAIYTAPVTVCLQVPSVTTAAELDTLHLFHGEGGVLVNRTVSRTFATKTICASVTSLSPFVVAQNLAPSAATVSIGGRVSDVNGNGISKARVSITNPNGETQTVLTNSFGYYRFDEVPVGETYVISVRHKRFQFANQTQVVFVGDEITDIAFVALP